MLICALIPSFETYILPSIPCSIRSRANKDAIDAVTIPLGAIQHKNNFSAQDNPEPIVEINTGNGRERNIRTKINHRKSMLK